MNKEEIENKITGIITDSIYSRYDSQEQADSAISACVKELSTLIQEERKEAFGEGYLDALKWCKTMGIKDSVIPEKIKVIKQYLSSIGKDKE